MVRKMRKNLFMKHIKVGLIVRKVARSNKHIVKLIVFLKYKKKKKTKNNNNNNNKKKKKKKKKKKNKKKINKQTFGHFQIMQIQIYHVSTICYRPL